MKCAVYARVSTGFDSQKTSIPTQIKLFDNYIKERGWELYQVYTDEESGSKSNRDGIQQLLSDAKAKKFDIVLAKELSRISRNGAFSYEFKDVLISNQIHFLTLDGAIDTMEDNHSFFGLYAWLSESEAQRTSARVKSSAKVRAKLGRFDEAPYGYDLKDGKLYIATDGSNLIVQRIFKEYIDGRSFDAIARSLSNEKVATPAARKGNKNAGPYWHGSTVRLILERKNYTGCFVGGKTSTLSPRSNKRRINHESDWITVEDTHEAIISKEDFELVQQLINSRKRVRSQQGKNLFIGFLKCGNCGAGMQFKRDRYVCGHKNKHGKIACSENFRPKEKDLIALLLKELNSLYFSNISTNEIEHLVETKIKKKKQQISPKEHLQLELTRLKDKKQRALDKLLDDKIDQDAYDGLVTKLNPEIEAITRQLNDIEHESNASNGSIDDLKNYVLKQLKINEPITKITPSILARFIQVIKVNADGQLEVHYRTSKPSASYVSNNIKLDIPKTHPNKVYVKKYA
ncbi:recombinase family protein [Lysinibacillus sp. BW-2-10]|uniref:recombinase family protein n=1 Tax=Lysinibacillus sp. BW-2-10 TaxID=2590030 RepID=UPI0016425CED|nr:recombinase family protein [Lysinibacillus sp. BW-2-10]